MNKKTKVLIVGGGPAGSSVGISLIKEGIDCIVIDKAFFPREKLCGGLITEIGMKELKRIGINTKSEDFYKPDKIRFFDDYEMIFESGFEADYAVVDRYIFDSILMNEYIRLGGNVILGDSIVHINDEMKYAVTKSGLKIEYEYLIGADGANSIVRKKLNDKKMKLAFCSEIYEDKDDIQDYPADGINVLFNKVKIGFAWVFEGKDKSSVGVGGIVDNNRTIVEILNNFQIPKSEIRGAFVPYGEIAKICVNKNIFLVGDAAGYVDPILGEGISYAILSGRKITSVLQSIDKKNEYLKQFKDVERMVRYGNLLQRIFFNKYVNKLALNIFKHHSNLTKRLCEKIVIKGDVKYYEVLKIMKVIFDGRI